VFAPRSRVLVLIEPLVIKFRITTEWGDFHARKAYRRRRSCYNCLCDHMGWKCTCRNIDHDCTISQGELYRRKGKGSARTRREIKISPSKTVQVKGTSTGGFRWIGPEFPPLASSRSPPAGYERSGNTKLRPSRTGWTARTGRSSGARRADGPGRTQGDPGEAAKQFRAKQPPVHAGGLWSIGSD